MEAQKAEVQWYFACCPNCRHILMQGKNGTDCCIKCVQCGKVIHIVVKDDAVTTQEKSE